MIRTLALGALCVAFLFSSVASAQLHKDTRRGFQIKPPKDFKALALQPNQRNPIARFQAEQMDQAAAGGAFATYEVNFFPIGMLPDEMTPQDFIDEAWENLEEELGFAELLREKKVKIARSPALEKHFEAEDGSIAMFASVLEQEDGVYIFKGTALADRFKKHVSNFSKATKSFKRIEKDDAADREAELSQMSDQERFLEEQIEKLPDGWSHLRTDRYLFLYNADKNFVKDLAEQVEVIRNTYEELYPPDEPIEAVSIVRVCDSRDTYLGYGGSPTSGGYWYFVTQELVIFDNPPRKGTHAILNHEAFHQYIYYYYGQLSPHSWYNEGHGDYFAGAQMTKTWRIREFGDAPGGVARMETAKTAVRNRKSGRAGATPLKDLMRFSQAEYYENGLMHYAQGWAVVHMLRESKSLEPKWERILPEYLDNLLAARLEVATEMMNKKLEKAEKDEKGSSAELSNDPEDYFEQASLRKTIEIQNLAYDKTFESWTDEDWEEFDEFYMEYVLKL